MVIFMRNTKFTEIKKMWEEKDFDNFIVAYMPVVQRYAKKIYEDNKLVFYMNLKIYLIIMNC